MHPGRLHNCPLRPDDRAKRLLCTAARERRERTAHGLGARLVAEQCVHVLGREHE